MNGDNSRHNSQYGGDDAHSRYDGGGNNGRSSLGAAGKRLRVEGNKRTEEECRQMLRLAEVENKELKDSLRYVEIQLAKNREGYA